MLRTEHIAIQFGGLNAVSDFSIHVDNNEIIGLIGPNGAGKTTAFNMITGQYIPTKGQIFLEDKNITGKQPHLITAAGIARTFQNIRLFSKMTVLENILAACWLREKPNLFESVLHLPGYRAKEKRNHEFAREMLASVGLLENAGDNAVSLPYGKQRRLEIVRALATGPKILLLDEVMAGLPLSGSENMMEVIRNVQKAGISIIIIEHVMRAVMGLCERIYVLNQGSLIAEGAPAEIASNPLVIESYLGVKKHA